MRLLSSAGVSAFRTGGIEGPLYAALLVNGVQWVATIITVICVDKARCLACPLLAARCAPHAAHCSVPISGPCGDSIGSEPQAE